MSIEIRTRNLRNGNKSLYLDIYENGKRRYETLNLYLVPEIDDDTKRQNKNAMSKAVAVKSERMLGIEAKAKPLTNREVAALKTLLDAIGEYISERETAGRYSASSIRNIRQMRHIISSYMEHSHHNNIRLLEVDKKFVVGYVTYLREEYISEAPCSKGEHLSPSTQHMIQTIFNTFMRVMHRRGAIPSNPMDRLDSRERIAKPIVMRDALTVQELQALSEVYTGSPTTKQAFMFCCFTGLRYSDVSSLTWKDIRKTDSGLSIFMLQQKTKQYTVVPLGEQAMKWLPKRGSRLDEDNVFSIYTLGCCDRVLKHMAKRAGITKRVSFHTARHTFATLAFEAGGELLTVSSLLGHTNVKTTERYAEVKMEKKVNAVNLVNGLFT